MTWALRLAPPVGGKSTTGCAMKTEDARKYEELKEAIVRHYDIDEEVYRQTFRSVRTKKYIETS